jgi:hypothetical protein
MGEMETQVKAKVVKGIKINEARSRYKDSVTQYQVSRHSIEPRRKGTSGRDGVADLRQGKGDHASEVACGRTRYVILRVADMLASQ